MNGRDDVVVEVCVDSVESAVAAAEGGADRIELSAALAEGGLTPSAGMIAEVIRGVDIEVGILVRPRAGDFVVRGAELDVMRRDIDTAASLGASAVVTGALLPDGRVDRDVTRTLLELARPLRVTFHRAFDMARDQFEALETLIELGCDEILTSGGAATALEGLQTIRRLAGRAAGRIALVAAAGVGPQNVRDIASARVKAIHAGSSVHVTVESPMEHRTSRAHMGPATRGAEFTRHVVAARRVAELIGALRG